MRRVDWQARRPKVCKLAANGLLRQYFPKGTDLGRHSRNDLDAVAAALNNVRPCA
ncbi:hypothetical protein Misp02_30390 [Microtetraspora sp. NBRC 16547]|nr:hypothetical protein Misp02_30390 [Microtetraspora sp. NBRC 16547]